MRSTLTRRVLTGMGFAVPVLALATGCPLVTRTTNPSPTPVVDIYPNLTSDTYTGSVMLYGATYPGATTLQFRNPAATGGNRTAAISTDANGFFEASRAIIPLASGSCQLIWPVESGATASATTTNFTDLYVSDPITNPTTGRDSRTPGLTVDVGWHLSPSPAVGGSITTASKPITFGFSTLSSQTGVAAGPFEYQIFLTDSAGGKWSSAWHAIAADASGSIQWDGTLGTTTDSPASASAAQGAATYQVKWRTQGVSDGSKAFGQSQLIPITLQ